MPATDCLSYDVEQPIRSESVVLASFSPDDGGGFFVRLCRYPSAGQAWLWLSAFVAGASPATYNVDHLACGSDDVDPDLLSAVYRIDQPDVCMERDGPRDEPERVRVTARVLAHATTAAPDADGDVPVEIEAAFSSYGAGGPTLRGRSELHGRVTGRVTVGGRSFAIDDPGQWHEQLQDAPRFRAPFTYACLVSAKTSMVALSSGTLSRGWLRDGGDVAMLRRVSLERAPESWAVDVETVAGTTRRITASVTHELTIPLYGLPWRGTRVVSADGCAGMINTFDPNP